MGSCSASKDSSMFVKSAWLSPLRTMVSAVSPCLTPFRRTAARPSGVLGPVLFCAFSRLAAVCLSVATLLPLYAQSSGRVWGCNGNFGYVIDIITKKKWYWLVTRDQGLLYPRQTREDENS